VRRQDRRRSPLPASFFRSPFKQELDMTPLDKAIRRELQVGDDTYTLTIDPSGLKLVLKGRRKGVELQWAELVNGDAALAAALQASIAAK